MIFALTPVLAAIMYGLTYAILEKVVSGLSSITYFVYSAIVSLVPVLIAGLVFHYSGFERIEFDLKKISPYEHFLIIASVFIGTFGWLASIVATKYVSASYAAIGEISYVLFVPIFAYLLFGVKNFNISMLVGGILIFIGSIILILGQTKTS